MGIAWALLGDNCKTNWGLTVYYVGLLGDYLTTLRHFVGYLGTTWEFHGHYLRTDCVLCWTTWRLLDYFKAFCGLLGDYLVNLDHFGTTWQPLSDCWRRVPGHALIPCSPLVPPLVLGLQVKNLVLGVVCHLQSGSSLGQSTKSRGIVIRMYDKVHLSYNLLNHILRNKQFFYLHSRDGEMVNNNLTAKRSQNPTIMQAHDIEQDRKQAKVQR